MAKKATYIQAKVSGGSTVESFEIVDKGARGDVSSLATRVAALEAIDAITASIDSQTGVVSINKNGSKLVDVVPAEDAATKAELSNVQQSVGALETVVGGHTAVIDIVAENVADIRYKETPLTALADSVANGLNKKINSDGSYASVSGYSVLQYDISLYKGERVRIETADDATIIHYAFYSDIAAAPTMTMQSSTFISCEEAAAGPFSGDIAIPSTAKALVVGTSSSLQGQVSVTALVDKIARNEKFLANVHQIIVGTYANFKEAFDNCVEVVRDRLSYVNSNYPSEYQNYYYIGFGEAGKSDISNWRPEDGNSCKDYVLKSTTYTTETVAGKSGKIWTYVIPEKNVILDASVPGSYYGGQTKCYDKAGRVMYSYGNGTNSRVRSLPQFTSTIEVATRNDEWSGEYHYIIVNSEIVPTKLSDYINPKCAIDIGTDGTTSVNTQNKALALVCIPIEENHDYIIATLGNKFASTSTKKGIFLDSSFALIESFSVSDYVVGSCNNYYNNVLRVTTPANAAYMYFPIKFTFEGAETVSDVTICNADEFYLETSTIVDKGSNVRYKQINGLKIGILGDSTSSTQFGGQIKAFSQNGPAGAWVAFFNTLIKPSVVNNKANGGATVRDTTPISNGVITTTNNTYIMQIESMISQSATFTPDYIFIVGCTNDESTDGNPSWVTDAEINGTDYDDYMESTFVTQSNIVIDINNVDCAKLAGAMRYIVERASVTFPNVKFIAVTPLRNNGTNQGNQRRCVRDFKWMAKRLSIPIIDVFEEANMPFLWDDASGKRHWLYDAYHPYKSNTLKQGAARHGRFIAKKFLQILDYETDYDLTFSKVNVSVSNSTEYTVDYPTTACTTDTIAIYVNAANASITVTATDADDNAVSCEQSASGETSTKALVYVPSTDLTITVAASTE